MGLENCERILLTGAGFTYNFGGFLAREMWGRILNNPEVQLRPSLVSLLKQDQHLNFESVYNAVMYGGHSKEDQKAMHAATKEAYKNLDERVQQSPVNLNAICKLLECFASTGKARCYIFTLNQDIFVERWHLGVNKVLNTPGIPAKHISPFNNNRLDELPIYQVPSEDEMAVIRSQYEQEHSANYLYYVKLHGSMNWRTKSNQDVMVIGREKLQQIHSKAILDWYLHLFTEVFSHSNRRLLVIGYGFGDPHINGVLAKSAHEGRLKLCVICPSDQESFRDTLLRDNDVDKAIRSERSTCYCD